METNKAQGEKDSLTGKAKEAWGDLTGDSNAQGQGDADKARGSVESTAGTLQRDAEDAFGRTGGQEKTAGQGEQIVGKAEQTAGDVTGNKDWQDSGTARQGSGSVKEKIGDAKEGVEHLFQGRTASD